MIIQILSLEITANLNLLQRKRKYISLISILEVNNMNIFVFFIAFRSLRIIQLPMHLTEILRIIGSRQKAPIPLYNVGNAILNESITD